MFKVENQHTRINFNDIILLTWLLYFKKFNRYFDVPKDYYEYLIICMFYIFQRVNTCSKSTIKTQFIVDFKQVFINKGYKFLKFRNLYSSILLLAGIDNIFYLTLPTSKVNAKLVLHGSVCAINVIIQAKHRVLFFTI